MTTVDVIYEVESVPKPNEKIVASKQEVSCGGPATNAAITCAFLGGKAALISAVGRHALAEIIHEELARFRITLYDLAPNETQPPPLSSILVMAGTGDRAIVSAHATRTSVSADRFDPSVLGDCALLLVDGHQMPCAIVAAKQAHARCIPVVFDGGSWKAHTEELLPFVTYAICSGDFHPPGTASIPETMSYLLDRGVKAAAITRGSQPICWATPDEKGEVTVPKVQSVDTLGAGDIFHGAFCYHAMNSIPFMEALIHAAEVAAYSCRWFGTRAWMESWPTRDAGSPKSE
jgi:sugar/nucleoside kinase (ribokinase family)